MTSTAPVQVRFALTLLILACLLLSFPDLLCASGQTPQILVFNSYHAGYSGSDDIIRGFRQSLAHAYPEADIKIENLDGKYYSGPEYDSLLYRLLTHKYKNQNFDLILATDDYAFNFLEKHHAEFFISTPVVFCGTNAFDSRRLADQPHFVGIDERPSFKETIELIFQLRPNTKQIVVIHEGSITGQINHKAFRAAANALDRRVDYQFWVEKPLESLLEKIQSLPDETVIFYFSSYVKNSSGKTLASSEALKTLASASPVPVFGGWQFNLSHGIIGGKLINLAEHGSLAGRIAIDLLSGKSSDSMPQLFPSPNSYMFDDVVLQRFAIQDNQLPPDRIIINRPLSFYQQHQTTLFAALSAFLGLLVLSSFLLIYRSRNRLQAVYHEQLLTEKNLRASQAELRQALTEIKTLQGIIPICSYCKQIRDDQGSWARLEEYLSKHSEAEFSHGICPVCLKEQMEVLASASDRPHSTR